MKWMIALVQMSKWLPHESIPTSGGISQLNGTPGNPVPGTPSSNVHQSTLTP
jgi:hypothetical protein